MKMIDHKEKRAQKLEAQNMYETLITMKRGAKAYERFLRKPYEMTIGKVEVIEKDG